MYVCVHVCVRMCVLLYSCCLTSGRISHRHYSILKLLQFQNPEKCPTSHGDPPSQGPVKGPVVAGGLAFLNFQPERAICKMPSVSGKQTLSRSIPLFSGPKPKGNLHSSIIKMWTGSTKISTFIFPDTNHFLRVLNFCLHLINVQ